MSVGKDLAHSVAVFHWRTRTTLFTAPSGPEAVLGCHVVNENLFVSCGVDHLQLWTRTGGTFEGERGESRSWASRTAVASATELDCGRFIAKPTRPLRCVAERSGGQSCITKRSTHDKYGELKIYLYLSTGRRKQHMILRDHLIPSQHATIAS